MSNFTLTKDHPADRVTREAFERRFMNAETNYDRYLVFKDLMSWIKDLRELNEYKDKRIEDLLKHVEGYNMNEYTMNDTTVEIDYD